MHETIKRLREQNNYSQTGLAQTLHISRQMYVKYENGEVDPPVKIIKDLSRLYNVSYSFIIDDTLAQTLGYRDHITQHVEYPYPPEEASFAASPSVTYGKHLSYRNNGTRSFETVIDAIRTVPSEYFSSILAFVSYLKAQNLQSLSGDSQSETQSAVRKAVFSKDAFFKLAGNIDLDSDAVSSFREESLI